VGGLSSRISGQSFADGFSGAATGYLASSALTASGDTSSTEARSNEDIPEVVVTGSHVGGIWNVHWPRGVLQGGEQTWKVNVGYNGFYDGAMWGLAFFKYASIGAGIVASLGGALPAEGAEATAGALNTTRALWVGQPFLR